MVMANSWKVASVALSLLLWGCVNYIPTFKEWSSGLIGAPIRPLVEATQREGSFASRMGWEDRRYTLANGNWVYVFPAGRDCIVHAEVGGDDIIVNYWTEGRCR